MSNQDAILRILVTSDVHGKIYSHSYSDGSVKPYGLFKLARIINTLRRDNTVLIDNGDTLEGSPLQFRHMILGRGEDATKPSPITRIMKAMGYDFINLGNHDFDYGKKVLANHIVESGAKCITANIKTKEGDVLGEALPANPRIDITVGGKRISLFGLITQVTPRWEKAENVSELDFIDAFERAKEICEAIKREGKSDYTICIYHGGFEKDPETGEYICDDNGENQGYKMLEEIDGMDVLITGHQHRVFSGKKGEVAYVQPGMDGTHLACIDINLETGLTEAKLISVDDYDCVAGDQDEDDVSALMALIEDEEAECQLWLDQVIGVSKIDLRIPGEKEVLDYGLANGYEAFIRAYKPQLITFLNRIQMKATGGAISSSSLFFGARGFGERITMRDLLSTYVFPNTLTVKKVTGRILREYLEKNMEFWFVDENGKIGISREYEEPIKQYFNYDLLDGVEYTAKISNPLGERIVSLTRQGEEIKDDQVYEIVLNNYRASGGGDFSMLGDAPVVLEDTTNMVDLMWDYISGIGEIDFEPIENIRIEV